MRGKVQHQHHSEDPVFQEGHDADPVTGSLYQLPLSSSDDQVDWKRAGCHLHVVGVSRGIAPCFQMQRMWL